MNKVTVKIANHEYTIVGEEKREYLLQLAAHVDEQIEATAKANPKLSQVMTAVLTSINIADEYYSEVRKNLEFKKTLSEPIKELEDCQNQIKSLERVIALDNHTLLITKTGIEIPIEDSAAPITDKHGNIVGTVVVFRDCTEKKEKIEKKTNKMLMVVWM